MASVWNPAGPAGRPKAVVDLPEVPGMAEELLARGYVLRIAFAGGSMEPVLRRGDFILVGKRRRPARRGDIVLFRAGGGLVAHRLIRMQAGGAVLKGDGVDSACQNIDAGAILGVVVAVERDGRRVSFETARFRFLSLAASAASPWLARMLRGALPRPLRRAALWAAEAVWSAASR